MDFILTHLTDLVAIFAGVVTTASLIANLTPTETDNRIVEFLKKLIDVLALNFRK